ncbi:type IV pilus assembly protein FimV, partial [Glaesserella parasuis]|uniref:type IV pilus assembly protein FimV n=1 Tax=Glaesserella parasuis TaxID=738 RepID=UPI003F2DF6F9
MAMIGQALKQIGIVLQDIHAAVKGGVNAPAPAAAPRAAMAAADKLDGADIYIAYGRYGQARDLLRQVLAEQPQ